LADTVPVIANDALKTVHEDGPVHLKQFGCIDYLMPRVRILLMDVSMYSQSDNFERRTAETNQDTQEIAKVWAEYNPPNSHQNKQKLPLSTNKARRSAWTKASNLPSWPSV